MEWDVALPQMPSAACYGTDAAASPTGGSQWRALLTFDLARMLARGSRFAQFPQTEKRLTWANSSQ